MLPVMDPEEDYMTIVAAEEGISASEAERKKVLEEVHANLKGLLPLTHVYILPSNFFISLVPRPGNSPNIIKTSRFCTLGRSPCRNSGGP